jgi:hypothetical protein
MKKISLSIVAIVLTGCANSSGVQKQGADSYTITTSASPGRGGIPAAKRMAYDEASAECAKQGMQIQVHSEESAPTSFTEGSSAVTLNFRCRKA